MNKTLVPNLMVCGIIAAVIGLVVLVSAVDSSASILPEGLVVSDEFKPGIGVSIGKVQKLKGEVVIIHAGTDLEGYRVRPKMRLYKGDTLITLEKSKVRLKLIDGSILSLASGTRLELNKSVYDEKKKSRSSFLNMTFGKARFLVVKLLNFKRSEFKVKTPTAVCGVRGSDFVIEATAEVTTTTAFEDTVLEIISLVDPDAEPTLLNDYESSKVFEGEMPTVPIKLPANEIRQMKEVFIGVEPEAVESSGSDEDGDQEDSQEGEATEETEVETDQVMVSEDDIGEIEEGVSIQEADTPEGSDNMERQSTEDSGGAVDRTEIIEQAKEDVLIGNIPDFPDMPE